jgi:CheY-like chemotaxis protein
MQASACGLLLLSAVQPNLLRFARPAVPPPLTKSIVLVDDEKSYTELMCQLLSDGFDCPVHGFIRPLSALEALSTIKPGVIVTDYSMPQIDGIEFIRQAAPLVPGASFLIITGNNLSAQQETLERLSPLRGVVGKPFGWRKLADEILRIWPAGVPAPCLRADNPAL